MTSLISWHKQLPHRKARLTSLLGSFALLVMGGALIAPSTSEMADYLASKGEADAKLKVKLAMTTPAIVIAILSPIVGCFSDRIGRPQLLKIGQFLFCLSIVGYWMESLTYLYLVRVLTGVSNAILGTCAAASIGDYFIPQERGNVFRFQGFVMGIAGGSGIFLSSRLAHWLTWRASFLTYLLGVPIFICALLGVMTIPSTGEISKNGESSEDEESVIECVSEASCEDVTEDSGSDEREASDSSVSSLVSTPSSATIEQERPLEEESDVSEGPKCHISGEFASEKTDISIFFLLIITIIHQGMFYILPTQAVFVAGDPDISFNDPSVVFGNVMLIGNFTSAFFALLYRPMQRKFTVPIILLLMFVLETFSMVFFSLMFVSDISYNLKLFFYIMAIACACSSNSVFFANGNAWMISISPEKVRGRNSALFLTGSNIGIFVSPLILEVILDAYGFASMFRRLSVFMGVLSLIILPICLRYARGPVFQRNRK